MIIDIHTHYGVIEGKYDMTLEKQLEGMKKYGIDYALISNIECVSQNMCITANKKMLDLVRQNSDKFGCMPWCCEYLNDEEKQEFEQMYLENTDIIKGLKIHPDISHKRADDECFDFFYSLAEKYCLPVLLHTKDNDFSAIKYIVNAAKKFPKVIFILGHMDISSDSCEEALLAVKEYDNIYGDTAWVRFSATQKAAEMGIAHKMMFGTDSPIIENCYGDEYYLPYYESNAEFMSGVMYKNALKIFKLDEKILKK